MSREKNPALEYPEIIIGSSGTKEVISSELPCVPAYGVCDVFAAE